MSKIKLKDPYLTGKIYSISRTGEVVIIFSDKMTNNTDAPLQKSQLELKLFQIGDEEVNAKLNKTFEWSIISFINETLKLQLFF